MDKNISELIDKFQQQVEEAELRILEYKEKKVEFASIQECIHIMTALSRDIQALLGDKTREIYKEARQIRRDRDITELGYFVEHRK